MDEPHQEKHGNFLIDDIVQIIYELERAYWRCF